MSDIKAIETSYAGCRFRSRLEARWAVFFDHLGIRWEYEPEGFEWGSCGETSRWLPDFHLPATNTWVEVKGSDEQFANDWGRILNVIDWGSPVPGMANSYCTNRGVLLLGSIPRLDPLSPRRPVHPIAQHHKGIWIHAWSFYEGGVAMRTTRHGQLLPEEWACGSRTGNYFDSSCDGNPFTLTGELRPRLSAPTDRVDAAYIAARSARFEHGQSGAR